MIKLCIFDLDGTLVNSLNDLADACNFALESLGFPTHSIDKFPYFIGDGIPVLMQRIVPENQKTPQVLEKVRSLFDERYKNHCLDKTKPYDEILELIDNCKNEDILVAVLSNKADNFAKYICDSIFQKDTFDMILGQKEEMDKKPAPDGVFYILEKLSVSPSEAVLIGDSDVDIITAKNSGIASIGASWGFRGREELENAKADFIADTPLGCIKIINNF